MLLPEIPVYEPFLNEEMLRWAHNALQEGFIANKGPYLFNLINEL
jgi:hypothetical protein